MLELALPWRSEQPLSRAKMEESEEEPHQDDHGNSVEEPHEEDKDKKIKRRKRKAHHARFARALSKAPSEAVDLFKSLQARVN